jgi:hypothetical protein
MNILKIIFILFFILLFRNGSIAQSNQKENVLVYDHPPIIPVDSAWYYQDKIVTICGKVVEAVEGKAMSMLSFASSDSKHYLNGIIAAQNSTRFRRASYYKGKNICITGRISFYRNRPEIILKNSLQLVEQK